MENNKILIIGGTGSLGTQLAKTYLEDNELYLYSRDESKHWHLGLEFNNHTNLHFIIGNINDKDKIRQTLLRHNFHIIILAAALKHIERCEFETNECINTNLLGTQTVLNEVESNLPHLDKLRTVCFISTDKACSPVNIYGMTKAISEGLMVEKSKYIGRIKFVCVRYGNVLNSRGSIIPTLHKTGRSNAIKNFYLTDARMTRFVMTLEQSVQLIEHAILYGESGDVVIPKLVSCRIKDLLELFSEKYDKPIVEKCIRAGEKMMESLINKTQSMRLVTDKQGYGFIKPVYKNAYNDDKLTDYNSMINPLTKEQLKGYLEMLKLI